MSENNSEDYELEPYLKYGTYEEYLDSFIQQKDMDYLGNVDVARQLVELEFIGGGNILKRAEFEEQKRLANANQNYNVDVSVLTLTSDGINLERFPLLKALADREEMIRSGKLACILFLRDKNHSGQEISGYIDVGQRFKTDNFKQYFTRQKKLLPRPSDLSFYNWDTQYSSSGISPNFETIADHEEGLLFKCKTDRRIISVDPSAPPNDRTTRYVIDTHEHIQVVLYDHSLRRVD